MRLAPAVKARLIGMSVQRLDSTRTAIPHSDRVRSPVHLGRGAVVVGDGVQTHVLAVRDTCLELGHDVVHALLQELPCFGEVCRIQQCVSMLRLFGCTMKVDYLLRRVAFVGPPPHWRKKMRKMTFLVKDDLLVRYQQRGQGGGGRWKSGERVATVPHDY